jgi:4-diphosphocytidyl-2C-methyl-D-erythritol kinase
VSGFGERLERLGTGHRGQELTLIFPDFGCPTGAVYRAFDAIVEQCDPDTSASQRVADAATIEDDMIVNDLYAPACVVTPTLGAMRDRLAQAIGRGVHLSGSGSTLFVLGRIDEGLVHELAPDWRVVHTRLC